MKQREGIKFEPTPEEARAQEIANQHALAAQLNAMAGRLPSK